MNNDSSIRVYINSSKPYYYPGEELGASVLLDVLETTNCNKMQIIAKGKQIVQAIQKTSIDSYMDSSETDSNESDEDNHYKNKSKRNEDSSSEENERDNTSIARNLDESKKIFKYKKIVVISSKNSISQGKYTFPFEVQLPENIPGSFLFLENNTYVEIIYSIKVKLNKINITEVIPIVIRQKENIFNYPRSNEYSKIITGCCFDNNKSIIKLSTIEKYILSNKEVRLNLVLDNKNCGIEGSPVTIELYQRLIIFPKNKSKKLKITKLVGEYKGKKNLRARDISNKDISFLVNEPEYASSHLKKTKSIKYFRHRDIIPFLNQSIKSDFVSCEYEAYAEIQFPNWSIEELGVFLPVLIYPPEKGVLSKTVAQISNEFINSILNKKVFLSNKTREDDPEFLGSRNNDNNYYKKNKYYEISDSEEDNNKRSRRKSLTKAKGFGIRNKGDNSNGSDDNDNENDNNDYNDNNDDNLNINEYQSKNEQEDKNNNVMNEDGSFGYKKGKKNNVYIDTNSNNIKKDFSQAYLDDELDDEFLDKESIK